MSRNNFRVVIPDNPRQKIDLAKLVIDKHIADGVSSQLNVLDMTDFTAKQSDADTQEKLSVKLRKDSETATENRDIALGNNEGQNSSIPGTVDFYLRSAVSVLSGIYRNHPQQLGDWGFQVDTSPPDPDEGIVPPPGP